MNRLLALALCVASTSAGAQSSKLTYTTDQLLSQANGLYQKFVAASQTNDATRLIALYHDSARIIFERQSATTGNRTIEFSGVQYKSLLRTVPLIEAPDRYSNPRFSVLKGGQVQILMQRQSVSRGYTAPNVLIVQPDTAGRFWIVLEKGIQKVK